MNKGLFKQILTIPTTRRVPKVATLALTTCVLVTMIAIDASASTNGIPTSIAGPTKNTSILASESSLGALFDVGHHRPVNPTSPSRGGGNGGAAPTTTTTTPGSPANNPAPTTTTTDPAPTTTTTDPAPTTTTTTPASSTPYPLGTADSSDVSGYAPPAANALAGYSQSYVTEFTGSSLPAGWDVYTGTPGGDPGAQWAANHVVVGGGILSLETFQDPSYGNEWVSGGLCQCGLAQTYGAYFVRSRVTGAGPTNVELLWPTVGWPPEIDFNETYGGSTSTSATVHYGANNSQDQLSLSDIDMTQWHTWGVIWTPTSITYTVDGKVWGTVTNPSVIPDQPMTLDLQQQTWCGASPAYACPTSPQSMQIDWVAEYTQG